jgi:hypothetical protein
MKHRRRLMTPSTASLGAVLLLTTFFAAAAAQAADRKVAVEMFTATW